MAYKFSDRVKEFTTTTGTGAVTLGGAASGYRTFGAALTTGDTCGYCIYDPSTGDWEVGTGTYTAPTTLARTTVQAGSNGTSPVNFAAGSKDVMLIVTASKLAEFMINPMTTLGDLIIGGAAGVLTRLAAITGLVKGTGTGYTAASASDITGQLLTGFSSGAGTITSTDTILQAINKLDGNLAGKQATLSSGTNIKTVNSVSLLGSGNVAVGDVTLTGAETLTNKTITGIKETKVAMAASDIDLAAGNVFTKTISGTTTLTVSNVPSTGTAASFILELTNGGSATVNLPTGSKLVGGTAITLTASGKDVLGCYTHDGGTTYNWFVIGKDVK